MLTNTKTMTFLFKNTFQGIMSLQNPKNVTPHTYAPMESPSDQLLKMNPKDRLLGFHHNDIESLYIVVDGRVQQVFHPSIVLTNNQKTFVTGLLGDDIYGSNPIKIEAQAFTESILTYIEETADCVAKQSLKPVPIAHFPNGAPENINDTKIKSAIIPRYMLKPSGFETEDHKLCDYMGEEEEYTNMKQLNIVRGWKIGQDILDGLIPNQDGLTDADTKVTFSANEYPLATTVEMPLSFLNRYDSDISSNHYRALLDKKKNILSPTPTNQQMNTSGVTFGSPNPMLTPINNSFASPHVTLTNNQFSSLLNNPTPTNTTPLNEDASYNIAKWQCFGCNYKGNNSLDLPTITPTFEKAVTAKEILQQTLMNNIMKRNQKLLQNSNDKIESNVDVPPMNSTHFKLLVRCKFKGDDIASDNSLTLAHFRHPKVNSDEYQTFMANLTNVERDEISGETQDKREKKSKEPYNNGKESTQADLVGAIANFKCIIECYILGATSTIVNVFMKFGREFASNDFQKWLQAGIDDGMVWIPHVIIKNLDHILNQWVAAATAWEQTDAQAKDTTKQSMIIQDDSELRKALMVANIFLEGLQTDIASKQYMRYQVCPNSFTLPREHKKQKTTRSTYNNGSSNYNSGSSNYTKGSDKSKGMITCQKKKLWVHWPENNWNFCNHYLIVGLSCTNPNCNRIHPSLDDFTDDKCKKLTRKWCEDEQVKLSIGLQKRVEAAFGRRSSSNDKSNSQNQQNDTDANTDNDISSDDQAPTPDEQDANNGNKKSTKPKKEKK